MTRRFARISRAVFNTSKAYPELTQHNCLTRRSDMYEWLLDSSLLARAALLEVGVAPLGVRAKFRDKTHGPAQMSPRAI